MSFKKYGKIQKRKKLCFFKNQNQKKTDQGNFFALMQTVPYDLCSILANYLKKPAGVICCFKILQSFTNKRKFKRS